jgi:magnesium chelatase subunit I
MPESLNTNHHVLSSYPFTAIVGQEQMKTALILNVINPRIGGVLIRGEKGTAKSTAVRSLSDLLPEHEAAVGCPYHCSLREGNQLCAACQEALTRGELDFEKRQMQVVDLPISATEDRVAGTLDIEHTLKTGEKKFEPGLLAQANSNILYVDEVNLMDDHIVDILLDAAAMGVNYVEREGVSYSHPSNFILVGTMNPEEGDIRPQLLDRFGLVVQVRGEYELEKRKEIVRRRLAFEADPSAFLDQFQKEQERLARDIAQAKEVLPGVSIQDRWLDLTVKIALELEVDGHRADINLIKAAKTLAAFKIRDTVERDDILAAAQLVLPHRLRRQPFDETDFSLGDISTWVEEVGD